MRDHETILNELLRSRGICSEEEIGEFLSDKPRKTYDPFLLLNMEAGVDLLLSEIKAGTKLCIYGDYDADGVTSICILSHVIGMLTENITYYVPSRFREGYGLNKDAIAKLKQEGVGLLITVDCGSVSYEEVELAKELGMKVIVTDHHSVDDRKADCILINPKQQGCRYPFKELAGCGVAFKMAQAVQQRTGLPKKVLNDVLDLVAVGTVGDIVSLTDENRTIVKYGLNKINSGSRKALQKLVKAISLTFVASENIAFGIAPHINAAGRMASASEAIQLFMTEDDRIIEEKVARLVSLNSERKKKQEDAYVRCMEMADVHADILLLRMEDIHEGIAGIAAGKVKEETGKPVIITTPSGDGFLKGTGRSIETVDIYDLLNEYADLFTRFGGHKSACGFLMPEENWPLLREALEQAMAKLLREEPDLFDVAQPCDMELQPEELTVALARSLQKLEPFGQGNPKPVFAMRRVMPHQVRFMGEEKTHARFTVVSPSGGQADCVLFRKAQEMKDIICGLKPVDLMGTADVQHWRGKDRVQLIVEELRGCE